MGIFNTSLFCIRGWHKFKTNQVKDGTDDRRVTKFDATMWYVINGTLQREFLTHLSFMLGVAEMQDQ